MELEEVNEVPAVVAAPIVVAVHRVHQLVRIAQDVQTFELEHIKELQTDLDNIQEHAAQPDCPEDEQERDSDALVVPVQGLPGKGHR